jgi:hypothetical protein
LWCINQLTDNMIDWFLGLSENAQMIIFILPTIVGTIIGLWGVKKLKDYIER